MADHDGEFLSEAEATLLWERAAEAAKAAEVARASAAAARSGLPAVRGEANAPVGYAVAHVREAALEAGIAEEYVEAALQQLRAERALPDGNRGSTFARRFLQDPPDALTARRRIDASPRDILTAMEQLFVDEPYRLVLVDRHGDPLTGGVMRFDIHSTVSPLNPGFGYQMRDCGVRQLAVTLAPVGDGSGATDVTVHGRLTSHNLSAGLGSFLTAIGGSVGTVLGAATGLGLAGLGMASGLVPVVALGGALLAGGGSVKGFRALHRRSLRLGREALDGLLGAIAGRAGGGWLTDR